MHNYKKTTAGFTLLELLVVVSIISILLTLGAVAYSTAQQKGRDAKRRADIKALQSGFEQFHAQVGYYRTCLMRDDLSIFPEGAPLDPKTKLDYFCKTTPPNQTQRETYCICALLETGGGNATDSDCSGLGVTTDGDYFCLINLQ